MAYKLQIGSAIYSGSLLHKSGDYDAGSNDMTGSGLRAEGNASISADMIIQEGGIAFDDTNTVRNIFKVGANDNLEISNKAGSLGKGGRVLIRDNGAVLYAEMGVDDGTVSTDGSAYMLLRDSSGIDFQILGQSGLVSGSGALTCGQDLYVRGDLSVAGDLAVNGSTVQLRATDVNITGNEVKIKDNGANDAGVNNASFSGSNGMAITFKQAAGSDPKLVNFTDATMGGDAMLRASKFYGDGSALTGISAGNYKYTVTNHSGNGTIAEGINFVNAAGGVITLTMPASSGNSGKVYIVKSMAATTATNHILINRAGSDTIDGETSVKIENAYGSVKMICDGSDFRLV